MVGYILSLSGRVRAGGDKVGGVTTGCQVLGEDSGANSSGPDGTHKTQCERDWGFETHSRRTFTRLSHSEASESALGEVGDTDDTHDDTRQQTATDDQQMDHQMAGWESIFIFTLHD